jgi:hypothetical protein
MIRTVKLVSSAAAAALLVSAAVVAEAQEFLKTRRNDIGVIQMQAVAAPVAARPAPAALLSRLVMPPVAAPYGPAWDVLEMVLARATVASPVMLARATGANPARAVVAQKAAAVRIAPAVAAQAVVQVGPGQFNPEHKAALVDQFSRQVRPVLRAELHMIRTVCKTSRDEQVALADDGEKTLKDVAGEAAETQIKMQQGVGISTSPNTPHAIQTGLLKAVEARLKPEQAARYRAEVAAREKEDRDTAARSLVAKFDRVLNLSPDQRRKIAAALAESDHPMARSLDNLLYNNDYLPSVPDEVVTKFLDERQKSIWRGTQRVHFNTFNYGIAGLSTQDDDLSEEDHPDVAREAARRRLELNVNNAMRGILRISPANAAQFVVPPAQVQRAQPVMQVPGAALVRPLVEQIEVVAPARPKPPPPVVRPNVVAPARPATPIK